MRKEFAEAIIKIAKTNEKLVFLTGDLGFMALEEVRNVLGDRFINAGVAEQNMASMAAALAYEGFIPFIYSISPFITLRPYEQIRNDICLHNLPVKIIANGGGYGYGIMGSTHHNIEDIGSMRLMPNMKVFVPFSSEDVYAVLWQMINDPSPNYLRLNMASRQENIPQFSPWRKLKDADGRRRAILIGTGTVTDHIFQLEPSLLAGLEVWLVSQFPVHQLPEELIHSMEQIRNVITLEEHSGQCGMNEAVGSMLLRNLSVPIIYNSLFANGYPSGKYGSQQWHLEENHLAGANLAIAVSKFIQ